MVAHGTLGEGYRADVLGMSRCSISSSKAGCRSSREGSKLPLPEQQMNSLEQLELVDSQRGLWGGMKECGCCKGPAIVAAIAERISKSKTKWRVTHADWQLARLVGKELPLENSYSSRSARLASTTFKLL